jgi:hypothetical protein
VPQQVDQAITAEQVLLPIPHQVDLPKVANPVQPVIAAQEDKGDQQGNLKLFCSYLQVFFNLT